MRGSRTRRRRARSRPRDSRPARLDAIVYATSTPDHFAPGNGVYLQRLLGLGPIPSIDIRNQCSRLRVCPGDGGRVHSLRAVPPRARGGRGDPVDRAWTSDARPEHGRDLRRRRRRRDARARPSPGAASWRSTCTGTGPTPRSCGWTARVDVPPARIAGAARPGSPVPGDGRQGGIPARRGADAGVGARGAGGDRARRRGSSSCSWRTRPISASRR